MIATDVVGQLAWRSWVKDLVIHNEPNNDREWKPYCTGCTWPGRNRTYNWSNYLDRQFFEAVRDFYVDVYYNINYYRTDPNYCTNIDPVRCNNLRNMSLWNPPMAPIYRYINYSTESPYSVMAGMIMLYGHFSYNLYSSPVYTRPELQGILLNNAWTRISESSLASAITYGGFPSQIQEFGWDPYKVSLCYNHNQLWPALPPNGKCVPGDRLNHTFASDLVNFMDSTERHNAQTINAYHIRGDNKEHLPDGNPNDGLTNWGSLLWPNIGFGWLYSYQLGSPGP